MRPCQLCCMVRRCRTWRGRQTTPTPQKMISRRSNCRAVAASASGGRQRQRISMSWGGRGELRPRLRTPNFVSKSTPTRRAANFPPSRQTSVAAPTGPLSGVSSPTDSFQVRLAYRGALSSVLSPVHGHALASINVTGFSRWTARLAAGNSAAPVPAAAAEAATAEAAAAPAVAAAALADVDMSEVDDEDEEVRCRLPAAGCCSACPNKLSPQPPC